MAVTETSNDFETAKALRESFKEVSAVNRSGRVLLGSALLVSAIGLWIVPVSDGDAAMRLIKLAISVVLSGLGAMFILSIAERETQPKIIVDTKKREMRVIHDGATGRRGTESRYALDDLAEVAIKDNLFTAIDKSGGSVVAIPVHDARIRKTLSAALGHTSRA